MAKKNNESLSTNPTPTEGEVITEVRDTDKDGNRVFPGMESEVIVIPELRDAITHNKKVLVVNFMEAKRELETSNKHIRALAEKYESQLLFDEDRAVFTYDDGEVRCEIAQEKEITFSIIKND